MSGRPYTTRNIQEAPSLDTTVVSARMDQPPDGTIGLHMGPGNYAVLTLHFLRILRGSVVIFYKIFHLTSLFIRNLPHSLLHCSIFIRSWCQSLDFLLYTHIVFNTFYNFLASFFTLLKNAHLHPRAPQTRQPRTSFLTHVEALLLFRRSGIKV